MNTTTFQEWMWTTMCMDAAAPGDNRWLSTAQLTTQLQDVVGGCDGCEVATVGVIGKYTFYPQSTGLITVIRSFYKHALLAILNPKAEDRKKSIRSE